MAATLASPPHFDAGSPLAAGWENGKGRFLIDGFPRKMDQALMFDKAVSYVWRGGGMRTGKWRNGPRVERGTRQGSHDLFASASGAAAERARRVQTRLGR